MRPRAPKVCTRTESPLTSVSIPENGFLRLRDRTPIGGRPHGLGAVRLTICQPNGLARTRCWASSPLNGPASIRCSASSLNKRHSRTGLCLRPSPLPGNRIPGPETTRPKTPPDRHWSLQRLQRDPRSPPIRGYSPAAVKSPQTGDCVVELRGLEPHTNQL
jgi:hypothetical protein